MAVVVSLRDLVDELQMVSHESHVYLNKSTGKVITITDDDFEMARNADEFDEIEEDDENEVAENLSEYSDSEREFLQDVKNVLSLDDDYLKLPRLTSMKSWKGFVSSFQMRKSALCF